MEYLAPPLECALEIRSAIHNGETVRIGVQRYCSRHRGAFADRMHRLLFLADQRREVTEILRLGSTPLQRSLAVLILNGCRSEPVSSSLNFLIDEMRAASESQLECFVQALPSQLLLPVVLLQFPAFLIVLLGPLMVDFLQGLS